MNHPPRGTWLIRAAGILAPASVRREWREEWQAELEALASARSSTSGRTGLPDPVLFALGAFPHALSLRREEWTMDNLLGDLRYALRLLTRSRGFGLVAALTLALGIGANGSIFSLVNGLVLRPPAGVHEPERLVQIARSYESAPRWDNWSVPALRMIREQAETLGGVAGYWGQPFVLGRGVEAEAVFGQVVMGDFFGVLGARPHLGRLLHASDDVEPTGERVAVLSHALWVRRFAGDRSIVGRGITLGSQPFVVVGVAARGFTGAESLGPPPQLWVPAWHHPETVPDLRGAEWGSSWIEAIGRLRDGVTFEQAEASMAAVSSRLREASPINADVQALLAPGIGLTPQARQAVGRASLILMAIAGLVLLLTCSNVATLYLARAAARRTEMGVRMTLGASRARLATQLVTEGLVVAALGTALALPVVVLAEGVLPLVVPEPVSVSLGMDLRVLVVLAVLGLGAGVLFSAAPAWSSSRREVTEGLREGAGTGTRSRTRLRDGLVVVQLALSLGLVSGAALLGRSVMNARLARPGFEPAGVQVGFIDPQRTGRYDESSGRELYRGILARAATLPGVTGVAWANQTPLVGGHSRSTVLPADRPDSQGYEAEYHVVGPGYFETLGIPLLRGRPLRGFDDEPERVVVVNEALAGMFWPGQDPIGKEVRRGEGVWRVVGLVADVQMRSLREAGRPGVYYPLSQAYSSSGVLHVKTRGAPLSAETLRSAVAAVDPELPVTGIQDLRGAVTASVGETRTIAYLIGGFALLALTLAGIGLYGLVSYAASQRVREMGVRIALGARPGSLVRLMLARGLALAALGTALGLGISLLLGRALRSLLFGVAPTDAVALGGAALLLLLIAAVAAWLPAQRASRVDAAVSLRG